MSWRLWLPERVGEDLFEHLPYKEIHQVRHPNFIKYDQGSKRR